MYSDEAMGHLQNDLNNIHHMIESVTYISTFLTYSGYKTEAMAVAIQRLEFELEKAESKVWEKMKEVAGE